MVKIFLTRKTNDELLRSLLTTKKLIDLNLPLVITKTGYLLAKRFFYVQQAHISFTLELFPLVNLHLRGYLNILI